ncbi:uncharacterized protein LOC125206568 [Salvia hispanica]|uniref:uncharacterized protein LOC125206568 n=1 Tax=Salvia hispanica TaxID=49212 RepID=UPI00200916A3|nr:uncharacterized protein LOC125206568 [Salvia hispanica]
MSHGSWPRPEVVVCNHEIEAQVVTSKTDANLGRRFYRCYIWKEGDCKFFRWIDPSLSPNQENYMQKLKVEKDNMQKELQARVAMHDMLTEKVRSKEVELESLQIVAENLHRQNRNLKYAILCLCVVVWLLI